MEQVYKILTKKLLNYIRKLCVAGNSILMQLKLSDELVQYLLVFICQVHLMQFNRSIMTDGIFDNFLYRMVIAKPVTWEQLIY